MMNMDIPKPEDLDDEVLVSLLKLLNTQYRIGAPLVSDVDYDHTYRAELVKRQPDHPFLHTVEPEPVTEKTVKLPQRMLSTNKAYSITEIEKWANDVIAVGKSLGMDESEIFFKVTPKLDGFAAYESFDRAYTRGDGLSGTDITHAFDRGLWHSSTGGGGPGEIVVDKAYFESELSSYYENTRNIIASVLKKGEVDIVIRKALELGKVRFEPFSNFYGWRVTKGQLIRDLESIWEENSKTCQFDTDGLVIEVISESIKKHMGATNHHHRWQIAYKKNTEYHNIRVLGLVWQTSKNGRLTPVVQLEPTKVSGVTISKATGHHYGNVKSQGIDADAIVSVCRSGLVIPYIDKVIKPAKYFVAPEHCPSCGSDTEVSGDNLYCTNTIDCPAQIEGRIEFFFKTLGNLDGFGPKVIEKICQHIKDTKGRDATVGDFYSDSMVFFTNALFGPRTGANLLEELSASTYRPVEDWRFLAAFSIPSVGEGGCELLLKHHKLADVFSLSTEEIIRIDGFAQKTADTLVKYLAKIKPEFDRLMALGFNLTETPLASEYSMNSPIFGNTIVFTGTMEHGNRKLMEKQAKEMGAIVSGSVSKNTDYLVCGVNVGANKTAAAEKNGTKILTEQEYLEIINHALHT